MSNRSSNSSNTNRSSRHAIVMGRFGIIFTLVILLFFGIVYKLIDTTVVHAEAWSAKGDSTLLRTRIITPNRGDILASDGTILATNLSYYNIRIDFRANSFKIVEFCNEDTMRSLCDSLAVLLPNRSSKEWRKYIATQLDKPRSKRSRSFLMARKVDRATVNRFKKLPFFRAWKNSSKTGLTAEPVIVRSYPFGEMAKLSIGRVGMTEEDPRVIGRSGLEHALDSLLYGTDGLSRLNVGTRGTRMTVEVPPVDGYNVLTTIDITMQDILESELGEILRQSGAEWGTAMIMEVATGDIKAMSNLEKDTVHHKGKYIEGMNRLVMGYEPGSVMKVMSMALALEHGYGLPVTKTYAIGSSYPYLNRNPIRDTHSPGTLPVSRFLEYSSNIGMVKMSMPQYEHNPGLFRQRLADMGFFDLFKTGLARERRPKVPEVANNVGGRLTLSRQIFGYSTQIPPISTCAFYNAIANDGRFVRPRLVKGIIGPDGRDSTIEVSYVRDRILSSQNAALLRKMMLDVVWEQGGTAKALRNDIVKIAGKTGTCKIALEDKRPRVDANGDSIKLPPFKGGYLDGRYRVTFCGFFPYENPKYTCIVVINDPRGALRGPAVSAGMVLKNVALKLFARGKLSDDPDFTPSEQKDTPTVYASFNNDRNSTLHTSLRLGNTRKISSPSKDTEENQVPDVRGVSIREALTTLEEHGYAVKFSGVGYVEHQEPLAGAVVPRGSTVRLTLRN